MAFGRSGRGAGLPDGRVVRFALQGTAGDPYRSADGREAVARELRLLPVGERLCEARVVLGAGTADYEGDSDAVSVIWEIGDRASAVGRRIRLSRLADAGALLEATGFDGFGRPCRARLRVPDPVPQADAGCGCSVGAGPRAGVWRSLAAIFCLSRPAAREYDAVRNPLASGAFFSER